MKLFKHLEAEFAFNKLADDHTTLAEAFYKVTTNIAGKSFATLSEIMCEEMMSCLTDEAAKRATDLIENEYGDVMNVVDAVKLMQRENAIPHYMIEAYMGRYEDEIMDHIRRVADTVPPSEDVPAEPVENSPIAQAWVIDRIMSETRKQWLDTYLQWNGIIGWTDYIWHIVTQMPREVHGE